MYRRLQPQKTTFTTSAAYVYTSSLSVPTTTTSIGASAEINSSSQLRFRLGKGGLTLEKPTEEVTS